MMNLVALLANAISHFDVLPIYRAHTTNFNRELLEYVTEIEFTVDVVYDESDGLLHYMAFADSHTMRFAHDAATYNRFPYRIEESVS